MAYNRRARPPSPTPTFDDERPYASDATSCRRPWPPPCSPLHDRRCRAPQAQTAPAARPAAPSDVGQAELQAEIRAAHRHVQGLGGRRPARSAALHGRQRLHRLRGQRHDGPPVEQQQAMGDLMAKLGITMGVFVVQTGGNGNMMFTTEQAREPRPVRQGVRGRGRGRQARQREVDDGRARQLRSQSADRHPDRQRHRRAARRRRRPREGQPDDGARAAERHAGSVPADLGPDLRDLPRGEQPGVQDSVRHVPHAAQRRAGSSTT